MELLAGRDERISATVQLPNAFGVQRTTRFTDFPRAVDTADKDQFDSHRPMFTKQNVVYKTECWKTEPELTEG